ncbi:MAG: DMT family transporter [Alphaproteobacteria bacterium]|nr:DMT family transporter [Alphaproteobacteria bacterium]
MSPRHLLFAFFVASVAGTNWPATKMAVEYIPPFLAVALRFTLVAILLAPWLRAFRGQMRSILAISLSLGVLQFGFMFLALRLSRDVGTIAVANQLYVPFSVILAVIFLRERLSLARVLAIALAFAGVVVMGFDPASIAQIDAIAAVLMAALSLAIASLFLRRLRGVGVLQQQVWMVAPAAPVLYLLSYLFESAEWSQVPDAPWQSWAGWGYGIFAGFIFHAGWYHLLRLFPINAVRPLMLLMPIVAALSGVVVYGDVLTAQLLVGAALTLVGVAVIAVTNRDAPVSVSESRG